jgi:peptide/nickel transport system substrate-binding protein
MGFLRRLPSLAAITPLVVALLAVGPRQATTQAASDPTTLYVANYEWDSNFDPAVAYGQVAPVIFRNCYDSLVRLKGTSDAQYQGDLATSWTSNAARTVWTFNLRHGVHFHDGTLFTADAVKFSIDRLLTINQGPAFILGQFMSQKSVKVLGPYKVEFDLIAPAPRLLAAMSSQWANWIVSPAAVKAHAVKNDLGQAWLATHDEGSGPYVLGKLVTNSSVELDRFPGYWGGWSGKHINRIVMTYVPEEQTRRSLIEKGDIDLT